MGVEVVFTYLSPRRDREKSGGSRVSLPGLTDTGTERC